MNDDRKFAKTAFLDGCRQLAAGATGEAEACFRRAVELAPDLAEAHTNLGLLLDQQGRQDTAEEHYRQALALRPDSGNAHLNLGALLASQQRFPEAEDAYRRALHLSPDSAAAWSNLGALQACRKLEREAEQSYRKAMEIDPQYRPALFNLAYLLLRQGRFEEGWRHLEARSWFAGDVKLPCPRWQGEPLDGRSLLIAPEAGHGDMIQFCRYAELLKKKGALRITVICHPALKALFATLAGVDAVLDFDDPFEGDRYDFWTLPFSIPRHLGTAADSIPADIPYLSPEKSRAARWAALLSGESSRGELRVGLVWKGNPHFENDSDRSLPTLRTLAPLGDVSGVRYFSLQRGAGEEEAAALSDAFPLLDLAPRITDFADSAAIVANLDLVICVDTAIAHLAGALGKRCWVLLPFYKTDWRWLSERSDSPWYPGVMRLFRQPRLREWTEVIGEVRAALEKLVAERRPAEDERRSS